MPFAAKSAAPRADRNAASHPALERAASRRTTLFIAPPGYLLTDHLAALLSERGRPVIWLRCGPEDRDPATLLLSLIAAARRRWPDAGSATLDLMRRRPGPLARWPLLFAQLARDLAEAAQDPYALVLEHCHYLNDLNPTLGLFCSAFLPALPTDATAILTARQALPRAALDAGVERYDESDLRLDLRAAHALAEQAEAKLPDACVRRAVALADGRAAALDGLFAAESVLGAANLSRAVERASSLDDLLARIAGACLMTADADGALSLGVLARLEYSHPEYLPAPTPGGAPPAGPWIQPLEDGWARLRAIWREPLRNALRAGSAPHAALRQAADRLAGQGALERAASLYLELGDHASAARLIAESCDLLMSLGQWEMLSVWLSQIPVATLHDWPWLVYTGGEIAVAQGNLAAAQRAFATAARIFTARREHEGACQSLLAESALAAWRGDYGLARCRAHAASAIADAARLAWCQGWAAWQLGGLMTIAGELDDALAYFERAAAALRPIGDPFALDLLGLVDQLVRRQRELRQERERYRSAYDDAERAEYEIVQHLHLALSTPPDGVGALLSAHGWTRTPLILKLPMPAPAEAGVIAQHPGLWNALLNKLGLHRHPAAQPAPMLIDRADRPSSNGGAFLPALPLPAAPPLIDVQPVGAHAPHRGPASERRLLVSSPAPAVASSALERERELPPAVALSALERERELPPAVIAPAKAQPARPLLTVHLLGPFRVMLNDSPLESWPSGRGRALFKYLIAHADHPISRDALMDLFWPDATPKAARNSLNVAFHGLRQTVRAVTDLPIVVLHDGAYRINPALQIWLDVTEFERHAHAGRQLEADGRNAAAEYEVAAGIYQGDFMDDDPYEEWPVLQRERLRIAYLDTLDRLGQIYFGQNQYAACATLCQLILARDNCREDAHCRLMRCYSRQGQHHLALRQYQACVEALRSELDVDPAPATTRLRDQIRRRESV